MKSFKSYDTVKAWRGVIKIVNITDESLLPKPGEKVLIDDVEEEIGGVEIARILTDPPRIATNVGLLLRHR